MILVEHGDNFMNYYSSEQQSNLVILGVDERKEYVYYFTEVEPNEIKVSLIYHYLTTFQRTTQLNPHRTDQL